MITAMIKEMRETTMTNSSQIRRIAKAALLTGIPAAGALLSIAAKQAAVIIPENRCAVAYFIVWTAVLVISCIFLTAERRADRGRAEQCRGLTVLISMLLLFAAITFPYVTGVKLLYVSGLKTGPVICLLCILTAVAVVSGDIKTARLLILGIFAAEIIGGLQHPVSSRDPLTCSWEVFRMLLLTELLIPLYIYALLPDADPFRQRDTSPRAFTDTPVWMTWTNNIPIKRIAMLQSFMSILAGGFMIYGGVPVSDFIYIPVSIISAAAAGAVFGAGRFNNWLVAYPVFVKLAFDIFSNDMLKSSDFFMLYIIFGVLSLAAAVRVNKDLYIVSVGAAAVILITDCMMDVSAQISESLTISPGPAALYGAELLITASMLMFGTGGPWSRDLMEDLYSSLMVSDDDDIPLA